MSGITRAQATKDEIRKLLNSKLNCNIAPADIKYIFRLEKEDESNQGVSVRVSLTKEEKKEASDEPKEETESVRDGHAHQT